MLLLYTFLHPFFICISEVCVEKILYGDFSLKKRNKALGIQCLPLVYHTGKQSRGFAGCC